MGAKLMAVNDLTALDQRIRELAARFELSADDRDTLFIEMRAAYEHGRTEGMQQFVSHQIEARAKAIR